MICAVHAVIGAALGKAAKHPGKAFAAGVASHLIGDLTPHKDLSAKVELPLLAVTISAIAHKYGIKSPEFWGAVGGFSPDFENAAWMHGLMDQDQCRFPTHIHKGKYHAPSLKTAGPQALLVAGCLYYLLRNDDAKK
jgi:hypothetical protein